MVLFCLPNWIMTAVKRYVSGLEKMGIIFVWFTRLHQRLVGQLSIAVNFQTFKTFPFHVKSFYYCHDLEIPYFLLLSNLKLILLLAVYAYPFASFPDDIDPDV